MKKHLFLLIFFLGNFCFSQTELSSLKDSLNFAVQPEVKIDLRKKIALELKLTDWDKAISYIETAEEEAKEIADQELLASVYVTTGKLYYSKDVIDVALEYYLKAEGIYKESGNLSEQMSLQNNLAIIYARLNNIKKATFYFDKVFQYHQDFKTRDTFKYASILNNMGTLYLKEDLDSSLVYYNRALDVNHSIKNHMLYAYIYTNIGRTIYEKDST
ncbi:tetratricopeptide repeat protein [Mesonia aquimarina]|uniref:tetratricopeptide repeat protein n=1 Tax=Mesonia aquimarina TaxID=1504967 RepID=UPI000EF611F1|nr:tetratricopeptide repeat protein [Mesonia aquimarina]